MNNFVLCTHVQQGCTDRHCTCPPAPHQVLGWHRWFSGRPRQHPLLCVHQTSTPVHCLNQVNVAANIPVFVFSPRLPPGTKHWMPPVLQGSPADIEALVAQLAGRGPCTVDLEGSVLHSRRRQAAPAPGSFTVWRVPCRDCVVQRGHIILPANGILLLHGDAVTFYQTKISGAI